MKTLLANRSMPLGVWWLTLEDVKLPARAKCIAGSLLKFGFRFFRGKRLRQEQ